MQTSNRPGAAVLGGQSWAVRASSPVGQAGPSQAQRRGGGVPDTPRAEGVPRPRKAAPAGGHSHGGHITLVGFRSPGACWAPPLRGLSAPSWLTPQPPPWPFLTGPQGPTQLTPHPIREPHSSKEHQTGRQTQAAGSGTDIGAGGLPCPQVSPTTDPRPGGQGKPAPQGGALPGPVLHRGRGKKAWTVVPSARVLLKNSSIGGRAGARAARPPPPWLTGPPAWQPAPRNSVPLGALHRTKPTVDSASDRSHTGAPTSQI